MIHVFVEHFVSDQGAQYFDEWIAEVKKRATKHDGFVSTKRAKALNDSKRNIILLEWGSSEALNNWRGSKDHEDILNLIHPFHVRDSIVQFLEW